MLLKREDLRGRMIRLIGQGRISATTRAMDDAGSCVARYLIMQLLVNVSFGSCIAIGLYFIGVPNAALDRITKKLARIFEVPIALITFIDRDHQWFKSQVGLPGEIAEAQHTSRELSVCGHVIANDETLVVEDLARDRRFANNPLLKERGLRSYAGVPLRSNNLPIGSLCIPDVKPRRMTERKSVCWKSSAKM